MVSPYLLSHPAPQRNGSNTTSSIRSSHWFPHSKILTPSNSFCFVLFSIHFSSLSNLGVSLHLHGGPLQAGPGAAACGNRSGSWQHLLRELRSSPHNQHLKAAVWCPAKSKGLEHTFCHTSHVILVTSGPEALIPQLWNGDISPSQRHSDLKTQYIPSTLHSRDTEHWSLPLSHNHLWKGHLHLSSLLSTPTSPGLQTACHSPTYTISFPYASGPSNKPALPAPKGYLQPSKLLTHPLNSRLTTTSSEKHFSTFQIKWVTLCWVPSHFGLAHRKQSIIISEVFPLLFSNSTDVHWTMLNLHSDILLIS